MIINKLQFITNYLDVGFVLSFYYSIYNVVLKTQKNDKKRPNNIDYEVPDFKKKKLNQHNNSDPIINDDNETNVVLYLIVVL